MNRRATVTATFLALVSATALASVLPAQSVTGARAEESRTLALATQMERSGQAREAERVLIELLASQPTASQALATLARLARERGEPDVVLPYAEAAAEVVGYEQASVHQTLIRALAASGLGDEALRRAQAWVRARPSDLSGYAELSSTLATLGRPDEAVKVLVDARRTTGDADVFSQELATLHEMAGDYDAAALEWLHVLAWGEAGVATMEARLRTPGVDRDGILAALESALSRPSTSVGAVRGGLELALSVEDGPWARRLAETVLQRAPAETRWQVLRKYYLAARDHGYAEDARWAAASLASEAAEPEDRLQWEAVEASLALELGDRGHASDAFRRILDASRPRSETRRLAIYSLVILRVDEDDGDAERLIKTHAAEYPDREGDLADLTIRLSQARVRRGDIPGARRALELAPKQPSDASTASRLEAQRGHLALFEGDVGAARSHLETAGQIPGGDPGQRTEILLFLDVFSRADSAAVAHLGKGIYQMQMGRGPGPLVEAADRWAASGSASDPAAGAGLMRLAAGALERAGFDEDAADVRRSLIEAYPATSEAPGALLALARSALPGRPDQAKAWLQRLIIDHPGSALAPVARRLLSEIEGRVPSASDARRTL
ncbi:MAG: hypothetical protein ACR2GQ_00440 [Gemmatimonadota bacterium]